MPKQWTGPEAILCMAVAAVTLLLASIYLAPPGIVPPRGFYVDLLFPPLMTAIAFIASAVAIAVNAIPRTPLAFAMMGVLCFEGIISGTFSLLMLYLVGGAASA